MSNRLKWIIGILAVLTIVLVVLKKRGVIGGEDGVKVAVEEATSRTIIETVNTSGQIYPEIEVKVSSDISGEITQLMVEEGDSVKRGQILARIYADIYSIQQQQAAAQVKQQEFQIANTEAQLEGLKAALDQSDAQLKRQKQLLDNKVISQLEYEQAQNTYLNAKSGYNAAKRSVDAGKASATSLRANLARVSADLSRTTIVSPMDGVVSLLSVKEGERVVGTAQMAGTEMMRVADMSRLEVRVDVTENDVPKVHLGDSAIITVDAYINRKFKGIVYQIASSQNGAINASASSAATSNDVTNYKVYIRLLPESYADLIDPAKPRSFPFRPGMTATADIQTRRKENVLSVPINAVTTRDKENLSSAELAGLEDDKDVLVFVIDSTGKFAKKVKVETGIQDTRYIEITGGVSKGQKVVSEPFNVISKTLKEDTKLKVVKREELFEIKDKDKKKE